MSKADILKATQKYNLFFNIKFRQFFFLIIVE
jgi:hypothetical protein